MKRALWYLALVGCSCKDPEPRGDVVPTRTTRVTPPDAAAPDATPRKGRQTSVLPEEGTHPDYPSARQAGTDYRRQSALARWQHAYGERHDTGLTLLVVEGERGVAPERGVAAPRFWRYPDVH